MARKSLKPERARERAPKLGMVAIGAALAWAAFNEPAGLTPQSVITWVFGALTALLLARAALFLAVPLAKILLIQWRNAMAQLRGTPKS